MLVMFSMGLRVEHVEAGLLARRNGPHPIQMENPRVDPRPGDDGLHRRHTATGVGLDLLVGAEAVAGSIGSHADHHPCLVDLAQVAAMELEELVRRVTFGFSLCQLCPHVLDLSGG